MLSAPSKCYLDRLHASQASLKGIFEAARMDEAEGRRVLDKLKEIISTHEAMQRINARDAGYTMGLRERLRETSK